MPLPTICGTDAPWVRDWTLKLRQRDTDKLDVQVRRLGGLKPASQPGLGQARDFTTGRGWWLLGEPRGLSV